MISPYAPVVIGHLPQFYQDAETLCTAMRWSIEWYDQQQHSQPSSTDDIDHDSSMNSNGVSQALVRHFLSGTPIVTWISPAIVFRVLGPWLSSKHTEPSIIVVIPDQCVVIPVLGVRAGTKIACSVCAQLSQQSHTDGNNLKHWQLCTGVASPSSWLADIPSTWHLTLPQATKVKAMMAKGGRLIAQIDSQDPWASMIESNLETWPGREDHSSTETQGREDGVPKGYINVGIAPTQSSILPIPSVPVEGGGVGKREIPVFGRLTPRMVVLGLGMIRNACPNEVKNFIHNALEHYQISTDALAAITTWTGKADEPALSELRHTIKHVPVYFLDGDVLQNSIDKHSLSFSTVVEKWVGAGGVAEPAAMALAGDGATLIDEKCRCESATLALAMAKDPDDIISNASLLAKAMGDITVVGIGPGSPEYRTMAAIRAIHDADVIIGYEAYIDLVSDITRHRVCIPFPIGQEQQRVEAALCAAQEGKRVALLGSGDATIYGLAGLCQERRQHPQDSMDDLSLRWRRGVRIRVVPGVTAAQTASAIAGAPLGHDFAVISLSDLLTPQELIIKRVRAAAVNGLVQAWYNPKSNKRKALFDQCIELCIEVLGDDCVVMVGSHLAREQESHWIGTLKTLDSTIVTMHSIVIVGTTQTIMMNTIDGKRMITPRGYGDNI